VLAVKAGSIKKRQALASWLHGAAYRSGSHILRQTARRRHHEREREATTVAKAPWKGPWHSLQGVTSYHCCNTRLWPGTSANSSQCGPHACL
jgi:hypothetical protein